jgi:hypothetical protein
MVHQPVECVLWYGLIWLRIGTSEGLLWSRYQLFGFHKASEVLEELNKWLLVRLKTTLSWNVFTAVTVKDDEECRRLGCYAAWFLQQPNGATDRKTAFFIVTAVKTSNLT